MSGGKKNANDGAPDGAAAGHGGDGAGVAEGRVQVVEYAAAIDVAKGFGMVCTRVPGSRPDRRRQKVWRVEATCGEVTALMDQLRCEGIQRLVLESTSDYWRIWYYLAEAAGLAVWLVNARDVRHLPGRGKSDRQGCVWHCKLNGRGMLRRSFVPPEPARDLRALTRTRARLAQDRARHQSRVEKILEDALPKISVVISDLFGAGGRRFLEALAAGERSPAALAALGDKRLRATRKELEDALTGRFRDIHAFGDPDAPAADRRDQRRDRPAGRQDRPAAGAGPPGPRRPALPAGWPAAITLPDAPGRGLPSGGWLSGRMRSPGSGSATPRSSSPSSARTPRSSPPPGTPPPGPG
jgi:hypothetical protein